MMEAAQDGEHLGMKGPSYQFGGLKRPRQLGGCTGIPDDIIRGEASGLSTLLKQRELSQ